MSPDPRRTTYNGGNNIKTTRINKERVREREGGREIVENGEEEGKINCPPNVFGLGVN